MFNGTMILNQIKYCHDNYSYLDEYTLEVVSDFLIMIGKEMQVIKATILRA